MAYDAVTTAVTAIRRPQGSNGSVSSTEAVIQEFKGIHGPDIIAGASGWISLAPTGSSINKAVPIIGMAPDGTPQFMQLSSPSGTPCTPGTMLC